MATKKIKTDATTGAKVIPAGMTGETLKKTQERDPAEELRAKAETEKAEKAAAKATADAEKAAAKADVNAAKEAAKAEKELAKADVVEAKKIAAEEKAAAKAELDAAKVIAGEEKAKITEAKKAEKATKKAEADAAKLAKAEAKANAPKSGAQVIREHYAAKEEAFVPTEEVKTFVYDMAGAAKELGIAYGRVYGCVNKMIEDKMIANAIEKRRKERLAATTV